MHTKLGDEGNDSKLAEKQEYYYRAGHFLEHYPFETPFERKFWEMHANGYSNREIEKKLKLSRKQLGELMHSLVEAMKIWKF